MTTPLPVFTARGQVWPFGPDDGIAVYVGYQPVVDDRKLWILVDYRKPTIRLTIYSSDHIFMGMVEVIGTDDFVEWFRNLDDAASEDVEVAVDVLAARGVSLGHPQSSDIKGASVPLRELRIQSNGRPLRVFYAFDPKRQAVLLIGGDKTGDDRFYKRMVPLAERIWKEYLDENP